MIKNRGIAPWIFAALTMTFAIAGCGGQSGTEQATEETPPPAEMPSDMPADTAAMADTTTMN